MTSSEIEPAAFRSVAQHLNHCATAVPPFNICILVSVQQLKHSVDQIKLNEMGWSCGTYEKQERWVKGFSLGNLN